MIEQQLLESLLPIELAASLFFVLIAYFIIKLPHTYKVKLILIPLLVIFTFFTFSWFAATLGYPVHQTPDKTVIVLNYRVTVVDDKKYIELWVLDTKDYSRSRLIAIPWTKQQEETLRRAKGERGAQGSLIIAEPQKRGKMNNNGEENPHLIFKTLNPRAIGPKAGER